MKVEGHVQTERGARNAIEAGIWSIAHSGALNDEFHKLMAQKGIFRAGTETPTGLEGHPVSEPAYQRTLAGLKNAYDNKVPLTFSTDADYWVQGKTRGELCLEFLKTWIDAKIPNADTLRAMTVNGYKVSETETTRGPIKAGFFADMIAMPGNPLEDLNALKNVRFVMKDGQVFKQDGVVTPMAFFRRADQWLANPLIKSTDYTDYTDTGHRAQRTATTHIGLRPRQDKEQDDEPPAL